MRSAIEIRRPDRHCEQCFTILHRHNIALADHSTLSVSAPLSADFVFLRKHGPAHQLGPDYPPLAVRAIANRIRKGMADDVTR